MDKDRRSEPLADEFFEVFTLDWTDEEARENADSVCQFSSNGLHLCTQAV